MNIAIFLSSLALFIAPGLLLSFPFGAKRRFRFHPDTILIGCTVGMLLSCLLAALVGSLLGFRPPIISFSLISASVLIGLCRVLRYMRMGGKDSNVEHGISALHGRTWDRQDYIILLAFLILVLMLTAIPYSNIGKETEHGVAFTYLIDNDFLQHSAIAAEIARGVPPQNIYFSGEVFQYHWLSHVFPAFVYLASGRNMATRAIMIWVLRCYTVLLVSMLFSVAKTFFESRKTQALVVFLALFAYSYYAMYVVSKPLLRSLENYAPQLPWIRDIAHFSNVSNGFFRDFLVEPHTLLALSSVLAVIGILHRCSYSPKDKLTSVILGVLIGTTLGIEGFVGMTMLLWFCIIFLFHITMAKRMARDEDASEYGELTYRWQEFIASISVALAAISALFLLRMFTFKTGVLSIQPYTMIIVLAPIYFLVTYGPSFILALGGAGLYLRKRINSTLTPLFLLVLIATVLIFFVRHFAEPNHVLRKSGKILQISLLLFSGVCLNYYFNKMKSLKAFHLLLSCAVTLALPALAVDVHSLSNIHNFSHTTYVSMNDYRATQWIKENTPLDAVVQSKPEYISVLKPGNPFFEYSLISMFAERRMVVGDSLHASIYQIGAERRAERERDMREMFSTPYIANALSIIERYGIDYIYVGASERGTYGSGTLKFDTAPNLFERVYRDDGVSIYRPLTSILREKQSGL